jgi:hypothetical protein
LDILYFFFHGRKHNSIHPKRTKLHSVGALSTTQSWVEKSEKKNQKGAQKLASKPQGKYNQRETGEKTPNRPEKNHIQDIPPWK